MNEIELEKCLAKVVPIAREAGEMIRSTIGSVRLVETKQSPVDLVTETDKNVEKFVFDAIKKEFPDHKFVGEESVSVSESGKANLTNDPTWIVDPVDGTTNFVHTLPFVAVCIGLALDKKPVLGVVYFPMLEKMYTAAKGKGAKCNGESIKVKRSVDLRDALICMEVGSDRSKAHLDSVFTNMRSVVERCHGLRCLGSAAADICAVASGQMQAFYEFGLHCWDMCAPGAVLLEAGGVILDTTGAEFDITKRRIIAACSETVATQLSKAIILQEELASD